MSKFIKPKELVACDKFGHLGHLSVLRNTEKLNQTYLSEIDGEIPFKKVASSDSSFIFDEWDLVSFNHLLLLQKMRINYFSDFFDIYPYSSSFKRVERVHPSLGTSYCLDIRSKGFSLASFESGKTLYGILEIFNGLEQRSLIFIYKSEK